MVFALYDFVPVQDEDLSLRTVRSLCPMLSFIKAIGEMPRAGSGA